MLRIFTTCPASSWWKDSAAYLDYVRNVSRWSEASGAEGLLVYADNGQVDPWLLSTVIFECTESLAPLVAVQPAYLHPYAAAKMVASLAFLHGRRVCLNMLAGGFPPDLRSLGDRTEHDDRYARTSEYTQIVQGLLRGQEPVSFAGKYYTVENLVLKPAVPAELQPTIMMSGSSPAALEAAQATGALAVRYPQPATEQTSLAPDEQDGAVRIGIIARPSAEQAWKVAHQRFPEDRRGQITQTMATAATDSHWRRQLAALAEEADTGSEPDPDARDPYWLTPFKTHASFCPYLVGSYERVGAELAAYIAKRITTYILDVPPEEEELAHVMAAFALAERKAGSGAAAVG